MIRFPNRGRPSIGCSWNVQSSGRIAQVARAAIMRRKHCSRCAVSEGSLEVCQQLERLSSVIGETRQGPYAVGMAGSAPQTKRLKKLPMIRAYIVLGNCDCSAEAFFSAGFADPPNDGCLDETTFFRRQARNAQYGMRNSGGRCLQGIAQPPTISHPIRPSPTEQIQLALPSATSCSLAEAASALGE